MQTWTSSMASPEVPTNENFDTLAVFATYGKDPSTTTALTWGYYGGRWNGIEITDDVLTLGDNADNYLVVNVSSGAISGTTNTTNWLDTTNYRRVYKITTAAGLVTVIEDHRNGPNGIHGGGGTASGGAVIGIPVACSDESTALTIGVKVTFRMFFDFTLSEVRASLTTAQATGSIFTVDILMDGVSVLTDLITIDNTEKSSFTATAPPVIATPDLINDSEMTVEITQVGDGTAAGLKVYLLGVHAPGS